MSNYFHGCSAEKGNGCYAQHGPHRLCACSCHPRVEVIRDHSPPDVACPTCGETAGRYCMVGPEGSIESHPARIASAQQPRSQVEVAFLAFADEVDASLGEIYSDEIAIALKRIAAIARRIARGQ